jgi:protein SCO1/2
MHWPRRSILLSGTLLLVLVVAGGGLWLGGVFPFAEHAAAFHGTPLDPVQPAPSFTLEAAGNQPVQLSDFRGKVVLLYFGYTFCPDICPTTLSTLARVRKSLGSDADKVQVVMITVDPNRDTPTVINNYVKRFDPSFVGLSGTLDQISPIAAAYGISFHSHQVGGASGYLVDHTPAVTVIDRQGNRRLIESYGMTQDQIASDVRTLLHS